MNRNVIEHPKNYPWKDRSSVIQYQLNRKHEKIYFTWFFLLGVLTLQSEYI